MDGQLISDILTALFIWCAAGVVGAFLWYLIHKGD